MSRPARRYREAQFWLLITSLSWFSGSPVIGALGRSPIPMRSRRLFGQFSLLASPSKTVISPANQLRCIISVHRAPVLPARSGAKEEEVG